MAVPLKEYAIESEQGARFLIIKSCAGLNQAEYQAVSRYPECEIRRKEQSTLELCSRRTNRFNVRLLGSKPNPMIATFWGRYCLAIRWRVAARIFGAAARSF